MERSNVTDNRDSTIITTQLSVTTSSGTEQNREYLRVNDNLNVINSRYVYYASKKLSSSSGHKPNEDYKIASAKELDCYMNTLLDRYIQQKLVACAINSTSDNLSSSCRSKSKEHVEGSTELMRLKLLQYEMNSREEEIFLKSLEECDNWRQLEEDYREKSSEALRNLAELSLTDNGLHDAIKKDNKGTKKLEEISKALLLGVEVDYFNDEESRKIMFKENF